MISFSVLASGFVAGILLSVAPGPAMTAVLTSTRKSMSAALLTTLQIFFADVLVTAGCLALYRPLSKLAGSPFVQIAAGAFLVMFAVKAFFSVHRRQVLPSPKSAFRLTIFNPGVWLSMLTLIALLFDPEGSALWFLILFALSFELGVFVWYLFLIFIASKLSERSHEFVLKLAFCLIAVMGLLFVIRSTAQIKF
jgi:threonine/homoserine/homoserine lactone efflux protein